MPLKKIKGHVLLEGYDLETSRNMIFFQVGGKDSDLSCCGSSRS